MLEPRGTRDELLDLAQELAQTRGVNAFSFHDLARGVGISTASVHHHFRTKDDLARQLMARYRSAFVMELQAIDGRCRSSRRKLERFSDLFRETLHDGNRLCLCGMLATEYATLSDAVKQEVKAFYEETEGWLGSVLEGGRLAGEFQFGGSPAVVAKTFLATLEGAMIAARTFGDESRLARAGSWLIASLTPARADRAGATSRSTSSRGRPGTPGTKR